MRSATLLFSLLAAVQFADAQYPEKCEPCLTCNKCTKCQMICASICPSPLCSSCQSLDCFGDGKGSDDCNWNCGPECGYCDMCDDCPDYCAPCSTDDCTSDDCSLKSLIHDECDNGDQCDGKCLHMCKPCLQCPQCADCRAECGHCDDCWEYPDSGACATDSCEQCKPCQTCNTCQFDDYDTTCAPCEVCVITHHDEAASIQQIRPLTSEQVMRIDGVAASSGDGGSGDADSTSRALLTAMIVISSFAAVTYGVFRFRRLSNRSERSERARALLTSDKLSPETEDILKSGTQTSSSYGAVPSKAVQSLAPESVL